MKHVTKNFSPESFEEWKAQANDQWQPSYRNLQNPQKRIVHQSLLAEQNHVCCYCGRRITLEDSHLEHFRPQESYENLALDYINLFASCIRETVPALPLHCGHAKGARFEEDKAISPLAEGCENSFKYLRDNGKIIAADEGDVSAEYMIELLNLDIAVLQNRRAEVLQRVFDDDFLANATAEDLRQLAAGYRSPDQNGVVASFGHVVSRYAEQLAENG